MQYKYKAIFDGTACVVCTVCIQCLVGGVTATSSYFIQAMPFQTSELIYFMAGPLPASLRSSHWLPLSNKFVPDPPHDTRSG